VFRTNSFPEDGGSMFLSLIPTN